MIPVERENKLYTNGKRCIISKAEEILFSFLSPGKVLDIGCGSGETALELKHKGYEVTGLDFSPVAVKLSEAKGIDCQVVDLDTGIPFDDDTFDTVWAGDIIEHVFDPIFVLREVKRVLVAGGQLLLSVPYDLNLSNRLKTMLGHSYQESVYKLYGQYKHHTFISMPMIREFLKDFVIKEIRYLVKFPKIKLNFVTKSKLFRCFTYTIMIKATI